MHDAAPFAWPATETDHRIVASLLRQADAQLRTIRLARALTEAGRLVDLAELPTEVGRLCAAALDLPPAIGRALAGPLQALLRGHEALADGLARQCGGAAPPP